MTTDTQKRTYTVQNSEKCFRFKPDAFENHAPRIKGIYELVTFDEHQNPKILFVGAAFQKTIYESLVGHADGTVEPKADDLLEQYPNLYFDFLTELENVKTEDDAQDVYWYLVQKYNPPFNSSQDVKPSDRPGTIHVTEKD